MLKEIRPLLTTATAQFKKTDIFFSTPVVLLFEEINPTLSF